MCIYIYIHIYIYRYYQRLGVDKIFLYDTDGSGEHALREFPGLVEYFPKFYTRYDEAVANCYYYYYFYYCYYYYYYYYYYHYHYYYYYYYYCYYYYCYYYDEAVFRTLERDGRWNWGHTVWYPQMGCVLAQLNHCLLNARGRAKFVLQARGGEQQTINQNASTSKQQIN